MIHLFKVPLVYFAFVFGVGFLLGMIRVTFLVPYFGQRIAEIIELPFMIAAIFLSARWIVRRYNLRDRPLPALIVGVAAAGLLLFVEFSWFSGYEA